MIYVVLEGNRVIENPDAVSAKPSGMSGVVIHLMDGDRNVIGNFPTKLVRYYGTTLPPHFQAHLDEQKEWASKTPEEREEIIQAQRRKRLDRELRDQGT